MVETVETGNSEEHRRVMSAPFFFHSSKATVEFPDVLYHPRHRVNLVVHSCAVVTMIPRQSSKRHFLDRRCHLREGPECPR